MDGQYSSTSINFPHPFPDRLDLVELVVEVSLEVDVHLLDFPREPPVLLLPHCPDHPFVGLEALLKNDL